MSKLVKISPFDEILLAHGFEKKKRREYGAVVFHKGNWVAYVDTKSKQSANPLVYMYENDGTGFRKDGTEELKINRKYSGSPVKELKAFLEKNVYAQGGKILKNKVDMKKKTQGMAIHKHRKKTLEQRAAEMVGSDWFILDKETQAGVISEMVTDGVLPAITMARGGELVAMAPADEYSVIYTLVNGENVKKVYKSKDEMDDGIADFYLENDVADLIIGEEKPEEPPTKKGPHSKIDLQKVAKEAGLEEEFLEQKAQKPAKKSLFDTSKAVAKVAKSKEATPVVEMPGLGDDIEQYDKLKAVIDNATAEKEIIGGRIKEQAVDEYLTVYKNNGKRPTSITLKDGDQEILFIVQDKYKVCTPEKESLLGNYDNLLGIDYTFKFDNEILDKTGTNGEKIVDIINDLISNSDDIPEQYKAKLVQVSKKVAVKSGSIERLLNYSDPAEIFQVIEPILALK